MYTSNTFLKLDAGSSVTDWKHYLDENALPASSQISWDVVCVSFVFIKVINGEANNPGNRFQIWEGHGDWGSQYGFAMEKSCLTSNSL